MHPAMQTPLKLSDPLEETVLHLGENGAFILASTRHVKQNLTDSNRISSVL
jgi:hypothetical protein